MLKAEQVPKTVIDAAYRAYWHEKPNSGFAEAIAAAINAWPGMEHTHKGWSGGLTHHLILPLKRQEHE